jgi:hypothetical protein
MLRGCEQPSRPQSCRGGDYSSGGVELQGRGAGDAVAVGIADSEQLVQAGGGLWLPGSQSREPEQSNTHDSFSPREDEISTCRASVRNIYRVAGSK